MHQAARIRGRHDLAVGGNVIGHAVLPHEHGNSFLGNGKRTTEATALVSARGFDQLNTFDNCSTADALYRFEVPCAHCKLPNAVRAVRDNSNAS